MECMESTRGDQLLDSVRATIERQTEVELRTPWGSRPPGMLCLARHRNAKSPRHCTRSVSVNKEPALWRVPRPQLATGPWSARTCSLTHEGPLAEESRHRPAGSRRRRGDFAVDDPKAAGRIARQGHAETPGLRIPASVAPVSCPARRPPFSRSRPHSGGRHTCQSLSRTE